MATTYTLFYKMAFLRNKPRDSNPYYPESPILSIPVLHFLIADITRDIGRLIKDPDSKRRLDIVSKELLLTSFNGLVSIWNSEDDLIKWKDQSFWSWPKWLAILDRPKPEPDLSMENPKTQIILAGLIVNILGMSFPILEQYRNELETISSNLVHPS